MIEDLYSKPVLLLQSVSGKAFLFCTTYSLKVSDTFYSKAELYCQLVPSLEMTYALRELYGIEGGKGQIWNLDESMTYRTEQNSGVTK